MESPEARRQPLTAWILLLGLATGACSGVNARSTLSVSVAAQQLRLLDADNRLLAALNLAFSDGQRHVALLVHNVTGGVALTVVNVSGHPYIELHGSDGDILSIDVGFPVMGFSRWSRLQGLTNTSGRPPLVGDSSTFAVLRAFSSPKVHPPLDEIVPTQDLRIVDKDKSPVATLGLTQFGEPVLVVTDRRGLPGVIWAADLQGGMTILGFDDTGRRRVQANLGPGNDVALLISEKGDSDNPDHDDLFTLDPATLREVRGWPRSIPWLAGDIPPVHAPISLVDQRDHVLWRSVEPATKAAAAPLQKPDTSSDIWSAKAIELARTSHALRYVNHDLPQGTVALGGSNPILTDTEHSIRNELRHLKGDVQIVGWNAKKIDEQIYLVTYTYAGEGQRDHETGWAFEVNLAGEIVRNVLEDPVLMKKYGWGVVDSR